MSSPETVESGSPGARKAPRRRRQPKQGFLRSGRSVLFLILALVVALAALGGTLAYQYFGRQSVEGEGVPVALLAEEARQATEVLGDRETDPRPLTEREVFERGAEELSSQDVVFELHESELSEDCPAAVWGERVEEAVAAADCSQVARADYLADEYMGAVALFKLADAEAARELSAALEPQEEEPGFVAPLSSGEPFEALGAGYSAAEVTVNGHYLLVVWAQEHESASVEDRANLAAPLIALTQFEMPIYRRLAEHDLPEAEEAGEELPEEEALQEDPAAGEAGGTEEEAEAAEGPTEAVDPSAE